MKLFITCFFIAGWSFFMRASVNIDSIYAARYTKTLNDSVFVPGDLIKAPEIYFQDALRGIVPAYLDSLKKLVDFFLINKFVNAELQIHTACSGDSENNLKRSLITGIALLREISSLNSGLIMDRLTAVGKGESSPLIGCVYLEFVKDVCQDTLLFQYLKGLNIRIEIKITGFLGHDFYKNIESSSWNFDIRNTRNSAYYEDLILIADHALLEGNYLKALEFYSYAADVSPANETYAAEQREKVRTLLTGDLK